MWFCDPQAPWQKGTNENTNGRARRYLPRDTDPTALTNRSLAAICQRLNTTPRKCLGYRTPAEVFRERVLAEAGALPQSLTRSNARFSMNPHTLLQIAAALGVPYGYLTGDTAKGNFSNTRISLIEFRRRISAWQHGVLVYQLCRAVWVRWMDTAVLSGALDLQGYDSQRRQYQACAWLPTKWDWIDPMKDASAEILQIEAGLKSRTQALAERGYDAEQVDREIAAERKREAALGLDFRRPGIPGAGAGRRLPAKDDGSGLQRRKGRRGRRHRRREETRAMKEGE